MARKSVGEKEDQLIDEWAYGDNEDVPCRVFLYERHNELQGLRGHYCGYVQTPWTDVIGEDLPVQAHGGVTYGTDSEGWIGFDCNHHRDVCISPDGFEYDVIAADRDDAIRWTVEDVKEETNDLAEQVLDVDAALQRFDSSDEFAAWALDTDAYDWIDSETNLWYQYEGKLKGVYLEATNE